MRLLFFLLSGMLLLVGCTSTKATAPMKTHDANAVQQGANAVQNAPGKQECQVVSPAGKAKAQQHPKQRKSTPGTFCGDKDVSDDF